MNGLLHHWLLSLSMLRPTFLLNFVLRASRNFSLAIVTMMWHFPWILGVDVVCVALFGGKIISFMVSMSGKQPVAPHPLLAISILAIGVMTFLMQAFFILFLRRDHFLLNPRVYIQTYVFRYVQFMFLLSFIVTFFRLLLFFVGIMELPQMPEIVLFLLKVFADFALFFWLDSAHTIKSLARSFERSANLLVYTFPFVIFIGAISFGALALLTGFVLGWEKVLQVPYTFASFIEICVASGNNSAVWQVLIIKYGRFIIDGLTLAFLYTWYRRKRGEMYAASLFEESANS